MSQYRKHYVTERRAQEYIKSGKCPVCMMLLTSSYHKNCSYLDEQSEIVDKNTDPVL